MPTKRTSEPTPAANGAGDPTSLNHPTSFTATALRKFDECPRSYQHAYLEKRPEQSPPSANLFFGNALHKALAFLYRLPVDDRGVLAAQRALRHYWVRQSGREEAFQTDAEEASWGKDALAILDTYCTTRAAELEIQPLVVEDWVRASLDNGYPIRGRIDRAERIMVPVAGGEDTREALRITDYKTGKRRIETGEDVADDRGAQVYAVAASRRYRIPVAEVRFLFLGENEAVSWYLEREDLEATAKRLAQRIEQITASTDFPTTPAFQCNWCPYREICPAGRGEVSLEELDEDPTLGF